MDHSLHHSLDQSVEAFWNRFRATHPDAPDGTPISYSFCDNAKEADELLSLVLCGQKQATAPSLAELQMNGDPVPRPGDLAIITDSEGRARAIVRTESVSIMRFGDVDADFARAEGEGDCTLDWWRAAHTRYYTRILSGTNHVVDDDLMIVCEKFHLIHAEDASGQPI